MKIYGTVYSVNGFYIFKLKDNGNWFFVGICDKRNFAAYIKKYPGVYYKLQRAFLPTNNMDWKVFRWQITKEDLSTPIYENLLDHNL